MRLTRLLKYIGHGEDSCWQGIQEGNMNNACKKNVAMAFDWLAELKGTLDCARLRMLNSLGRIAVVG